MGHFERALDETRASVTEEMEREYEAIQGKLKQEAYSTGTIGFALPGTGPARGG
jgi:transitional endoplasmic reticulum ATPase